MTHPDDELLDELPGDSEPARLDLLPHAGRVGELLRAPGAIEHWRQRCRESYQESRLRRAQLLGWRERTEEQRAILKDHSLDRMADDGCPRIEMDPVSAAQEPYGGGPLPFSPRHSLSLADCYFVLAQIHDAVRRDADTINPFGPGDERWATYPPEAGEECVFWLTMATHLPGLRATDRVTIEECLARVEADLDASGVGPTTPPQSVEVVNWDEGGRTIGMRLFDLFSGLLGGRRHRRKEKNGSKRPGRPGLDEKTRSKMIKEYDDWKASGLTQREYFAERGNFPGMDRKASLDYLDRCRKQWEAHSGK